jgi:hypothetical protein
MEATVKKLIIIIACFFIENTFAQINVIEQPSLGPSKLTIANRTNTEVVLYVWSKHYSRSEGKIPANSVYEWTAGPGDTFFNVSITTVKDGKRHEKTYGLDLGVRHHVDWNDVGVLDVYKTPAYTR